MNKKIISLFLACVFLFSNIPMHFFAEGAVYNMPDYSAEETVSDKEGEELPQETDIQPIVEVEKVSTEEETNIQGDADIKPDTALNEQPEYIAPEGRNVPSRAPAPPVYIPGNITFTADGGIPEGSTEYNMQTDTSGTFTVRYSNTSGSYNTVLLIESPEYGADFEQLPDVNTIGIKEVLKLDNHRVLVRLTDTEVADISIDFKLKTVALTPEQAAQWMDNGSLSPTRMAATEYNVPAEVPLADTLVSGIKYTEKVNSTLLPKIFEQEKVSNTYSYKFSVSSVAPIQDFMLYRAQTQWGGYGDMPGPLNEGLLGYEIPTVHSGDTPLVEIKNIKLYVPDDRLILEGFTSFTYVTGTATLDKFDALWGDWSVSPKQSDANGSYYIITPSSRWFNISATGKLNAKSYGARVFWGLKDLNDPLPWTPGAYTDYFGANTEVTYRVAGDSTDKIYSHTGPQVQVWTQETDVTKHAYNPSRNEDAGLDKLVVAGSYHKDEMFTYTTNSWYWGVKNKIKTDFVPVYTNEVVQRYEFPHVIQPKTISFYDQGQYVLTHQQWLFNGYKDQLNGKMTEIKSVYYTTYDGVRHMVPQTEIDILNAKFANADGAGTYGMQQSKIGSVNFSAATDSNHVVSVDIEWNHLATVSRFGYTQNTPMYNTVVNGAQSLGGNIYTAGVSFDYMVDNWIDPQHTIPASQQPDARVRYTVESLDGTTINHENSKYLWFSVMPQLCPYLIGKDVGPQENYYLNGTTAVLGDIGLFVGRYGERKDTVTNPIIELSVQFHNTGTTAGVQNNATWKLSNDNKFANITEEQGIAFLSGAFTAMPKLSGWVFTYTTGKTEGEHTWTVPQITDEEGEQVQIPLAEGDYFKSLKISYQGDLQVPHTGIEDSRDTFWLMKNIELKKHKNNPFTGEEIKLNENYIRALIRLNSKLFFDNCEDGDHNTTGQIMKYEISNRGQ